MTPTTDDEGTLDSNRVRKQRSEHRSGDRYSQAYNQLQVEVTRGSRVEEQRISGLSTRNLIALFITGQLINKSNQRDQLCKFSSSLKLLSDSLQVNLQSIMNYKLGKPLIKLLEPNEFALKLNLSRKLISNFLPNKYTDDCSAATMILSRDVSRLKCFF